MVVKTTKDGVVQLYLNGELKLEQPEVNGVTIGSKSEWIEVDGEWIETKSAGDYDTAFVGKDAALTYTDVSDDGSVFVDVGGRISNINVNGGIYSGSALCENATGWYGSGICMTGSAGGNCEVSLAEAVFSGCAVNPLNGSTGHGGAIETYGGGLISVQDSVFSGNSANGTGAAGGAIAMVEFQGTGKITGSTFSGNSAYFGGAVQQNRGTLTVTGSLFLGNSAAGDPTDTYSPGGGAIELHQGATASISGSTFSANTSRDGGAIYNDTFNAATSTATVDGCIFDANTADYQGGAIYNYASMTVTDSSFTGNNVKATGYSSFGGAIVNTENGTLTVTGGEFSENSASYGGAIASYVDYKKVDTDTAALTVEGAKFTDNASASGGGIYIQSGTADMTVISGSDFSGNTATSGGGAICQCFGAMTVTGGTFSGNNGGVDHGEELPYGSPEDYYQGGAIAAWDYGTKTSTITGAKFDSNTASYGGAISYSYASAPLVVSDCEFFSNGGEATEKGGAIWNRAESTGIISVKGSTFNGNTAKAGGAIWNGGNMKLESVVLASVSDTVYNNGSLTFAGANTIGAGVVNDGKITFSVTSGTDALLSDLGKFDGTGSYLLSLAADAVSAGALFAASAGTFSGALSVKLGDTAFSDSFTLNGGILGNDLAVAGDTVLRLIENSGALTVKRETLEKLVPAVSKDGSVIVWTDSEYTGGFLVEIGTGDSFGNAIRIATDGTAFDVVSHAGNYFCRATEREEAFAANSASWTASASAPRQVISNGNGRSDIFFASVDENDLWSKLYQAKNTVTGETVEIAGKNRIRDTFSGSESDANILYLSDTDNGDALFMDDVYSQFGDAARLGLIREVRAGAGDDIIDMTSDKYTAELAGMTVRGGAGNDVIWGAAGGNMLFGDDGNDRITGGAGNDVIAGGEGNDILNGGGGSDTFTFCENWGNDVVSQAEDGSVTLWFAAGDESKWDAASLAYSDGDNRVTVSGVTADKVTLMFGSEKEAERFAQLSAEGAFLGSTSEAVFETETARTQGILASL